jgi:protein disulfide-isomerase A1
MAAARSAALLALVLVLCSGLHATVASDDSEHVQYEEGPDGVQVPVIKAVNDEDYVDSDVVVLAAANFTEAIEKNKMILVEFYAPWCGHCKQLKPEYGAAATRLKKTHPEVVLAKFDAVADDADAITKEFDIQGFPTMKWFVDGSVHPKDCHQREASEIVKWVSKKSGPPVQQVMAAADMERIKDPSTRYAVVGFFEDIEAAEFKIFVELASHDDSFDYHYVSDKSIAKVEGVSKMPAVVFYRNFDEPKVPFDKAITAGDLAEAVRMHSRPRLIEMTDETAAQIFDNDLPKLLLFRPTSALAEFKKASDDAELRGHFIFATVGADADEGLADFLGVDASSAEPELFLFEAQENKKYRLAAGDSVSVASIKQLAHDFKAKTLKPFLKSAPVDPKWDEGAVKSISATQWEAVVLDASKHVVVEIYAPWCGHCKKMEPIYLKAAEFLDNKYSDSLVFAKMDGTVNEVEGINVGGFPTVLAFSLQDKTPKDLSEQVCTDAPKS